MRATREETLACLKMILEVKLKLSGNGDSFGEEVGLLGQGIGLDSIEILQVVAAIEEEFGLTVDDNELKPDYFRTLGSLCSFIQERLS